VAHSKKTGEGLALVAQQWQRCRRVFGEPTAPASEGAGWEALLRGQEKILEVGWVEDSPGRRSMVVHLGLRVVGWGRGR
jgi:hypothetical protein